MRSPFRSPLRFFVALAAVVGFGFPSAPLIAASTGKAAATPAIEVKLEDPKVAQGIKYRLLGPAWGGRVSRVAGVPGDRLTYYVASASGGVWKSNDGGKSFFSVWDAQPISSIGSIAVAPSDPNVVYVGSGEANIRGNVAAGNGIYKSTDAGKTWNHVWKQEGQIGKMAIHPKNADIAFAAVLGHAFGPNPERGVYRTQDGGKTWQQVLKKDADTGASDVEIDPNNPSVVFAGLWQARRRPWELTSGGPGSGLYVSRDGGETWNQITGSGIPEGTLGKVGIAVAPSDSRRVYAIIEAEQGGLFRSDDGGESWKRVSGSSEVRQRAWYYSTLTVHPNNPDEVWCPQVPMLKSIDGGKTFKHVDGIHHGDHHDVWFDPTDPKRMISGNDGGVDISLDGGESWWWPPIPINQHYHVSADSRDPFWVAASMQDIGTAQGPSNSLSSGGIRNSDWHGVGGGEAGWVVSDPNDPDIVYAGEYGGYISRYDGKTGQERNVAVYPDNPSGHGAEDLLYRFQWTAPIAVSPHTKGVVYHGGNVLFRSSDGGQTWTAISPDLTRNDKSKQKWSGGPITGDNTGVEIYCTIFVVAESPRVANTIWAGSDDGLVHITRDGGAKWENVTPKDLPEWGTVSMIEPSYHEDGVAYLVVDAHRLDDMKPYLWKTADFGKTWKRLDGRLPKDIYLHAIREDKDRRGVLYLGTERGVALSTDGGTSWSSLRLNLPTVAVHDFAYEDGKLVVGTHGRAIWVLDDLRHLFARADAEKARAEGARVQLLAPASAPRYTERWDRRRLAVWATQNPSNGIAIPYWLKEAAKGEVVLEIFDGAGKRVRKLSSTPREPIGSTEYVEEEREQWKQAAIGKEAGWNVATWDLDWDGAEMIQGGILDAGFPAFGPTALPGRYKVMLTVDGESSTESFEVLADPRFERTPEVARNEEAQLAFSLEVADAITRLTRSVERLRTARKQLAARNELITNEERAKELIARSKDLIGRLDDLEAKFHNPKAEAVYDILAKRGGAQLYSRIAPLFSAINQAFGAPTQGTREEFVRQKATLDGLVQSLDGLLTDDLAKLNESAGTLGLPIVWLPAAK